MALYQYQAITSDGKKRKGVIEAQSERDAKDKLRGQGLMVAKIELKENVSKRQNLTGDDLQAFTVQLSQLVSAGIPLYESLIAIEEQSRGEAYDRILLSICEQIKGGASLSEAMSAYPVSFDRLYCSMVKAGESVGALGTVLEKLSIFLTKQNALKRQISTAMIYPAVLATFSLLVVVALLMFVIPSIEGLFEGRKLNGFTTFVISTSHFLQNWWWILLPSVIAIISGLFYYFRSPTGKAWVESHFIKLPVIGTLMKQAATARFCRTLGTLQQGGMTMIDAMRIARQVMGNVVLEKEILDAEARIVEGSSLSAELQKSRWFPQMMVRMIKVGEESGNSVVMLNKIAEMYEAELEKTLDRALALVQPLILIFIGVVIGTILLAVLVPLTDVSSLGM
jgi:general secretion pathway protein F/type IV pilus assembly protein PilC